MLRCGPKQTLVVLVLTLAGAEAILSRSDSRQDLNPAKPEPELDRLVLALLDPAVPDSEFIYLVGALVACATDRGPLRSQTGIELGRNLSTNIGGGPDTDSVVAVNGTEVGLAARPNAYFTDVNLYYLGRRLFDAIKIDSAAVGALIVVLSDVLDCRTLPNLMTPLFLFNARRLTEAHIGIFEDVIAPRYDIAVLDRVPDLTVVKVHHFFPRLDNVPFRNLLRQLPEAVRGYFRYDTFGYIYTEENVRRLSASVSDVFQLGHRLHLRAPDLARVPRRTFSRIAPYLDDFYFEDDLYELVWMGEYDRAVELLRHPSIRYYLSASSLTWQSETDLHCIHLVCHVALRDRRDDVVDAVLDVPGVSARLKAALDVLEVSFADGRNHNVAYLGLLTVLQSRYAQLREQYLPGTSVFLLPLDLTDVVLDHDVLRKFLVNR